MTTSVPRFIPSRWLGETPDAPRDPDLPEADLLTDRATLASWLSASWNVPGAVDPSEIVYESVRYKPGVRLTAVTRLGALRVTWRAFPTGDAEVAWQKLIDGGVRGQDRLRAGSIIGLRFPQDHVLSGLTRLVPGRLGATYVRRLIPGLTDERTRLRSYSFDPTLIRYKPERHAVFHLTFTVRDAGDGHKERRRAIARVLPPGSPPPPAPETSFTPRPLAWDADNGVSIESFVPGRTLAAVLAGGGDDELAPDAGTVIARDDALTMVGSALAALHALGAVGRRILEPPRAHVPLWEPAIRDDVSRVIAALAAAASPVASPTTVHGDLHPGQVLFDGERWWLVDLDKRGRAAPERDLGDLIAALLEADAGASLQELRAPLVAGYRRAGGGTLSESALRTWTAAAVVRRAEAPLRNLHPDRHAIARRLLALAEDIAGT